MKTVRAPLTVFALVALVSWLVPETAMAHPGHEGLMSWSDGFSHPLHGWDHLAAMIGVGLWAAQQKGHAMWAIPASFLLLMAVGGVMGFSGLAVPGTEVMIALSVVTLGALVILHARMNAVWGAGVVGLFAFFHGFAHGAEMPHAATFPSYGLGFLGATALLHALGFIAMRTVTAVIPGRRQFGFRRIP